MQQGCVQLYLLRKSRRWELALPGELSTCGRSGRCIAPTLTMCSESSPFSLVDSSIRQGTGVRCCVISTTGAPLRQLATGTLLGMSCKVHTENDAAEM